MRTDKKDKGSSLSKLTTVNEEMTRHMADIFEKRSDPNWKALQQVERNRKALLDKSELGI